MHRRVRKMARRSALLCAVYAGSAYPLAGQDRSQYPTNRGPEKYGIDWVGFYDRADSMTAATRKEFPLHLDLAYGKDPKQKLDLYLPRERPDSAPVFIFIQGGGFVEGDRAHYGYVARLILNR